MRSQIGKQRVLRLHRFLLVSLFASSPHLDQMPTMTNSKYGFRILTSKRLSAWKGDSSSRKIQLCTCLRPFSARFKAKSFVIFHLFDWQKIREPVDKYKLFVTNRVNLVQTQNLARGDSRGGSTPPLHTIYSPQPILPGNQPSLLCVNSLLSKARGRLS